MPDYNVLWAVTDIITAPDGEAALNQLRDRLAAAGFSPYDGTPDLVPDEYQLAFLSEPQDNGTGDQSR